jgi:hypothetical protein
MEKSKMSKADKQEREFEWFTRNLAKLAEEYHEYKDLYMTEIAENTRLWDAYDNLRVQYGDLLEKHAMLRKTLEEEERQARDSAALLSTIAKEV